MPTQSCPKMWVHKCIFAAALAILCHALCHFRVLVRVLFSTHLSCAGADSIQAAAEVALRWTLLVVRLTGMAVLGLGLLPVLVGLFLELTVLPFRRAAFHPTAFPSRLPEPLPCSPLSSSQIASEYVCKAVHHQHKNRIRLALSNAGLVF